MWILHECCEKIEEKMIEKLSRNGCGALRMTRMPADVPAEFFSVFKHVSYKL